MCCMILDCVLETPCSRPPVQFHSSGRSSSSEEWTVRGAHPSGCRCVDTHGSQSFTSACSLQIHLPCLLPPSHVWYSWHTDCSQEREKTSGRLDFAFNLKIEAHNMNRFLLICWPLCINPTKGLTDKLKTHVHTLCLGLKQFYGKKTELKNELTKRKHKDYVQHEDNSQVSHVAMLSLTVFRKIMWNCLVVCGVIVSGFRLTPII